MKRIVSTLLLFGLVIGLLQPAFAGLEEKKATLAKVRKYIKILDQRIIKARKARKINKIAELKEIKRKELKRAKRLKQEIAKLGKGKGKAKGRAKGLMMPKGRFQVGLGFGGGAGMLGVGYGMLVAGLDLLLGAGYGIGNQYSVVTVGLAGVFPFGNNYAGLELGLASYSETVSDVLGVSGNIEKGSKAGIGIFGGTKLGMVDAQIGYNTALGLTVGAIYKF